MSGKSGIVDTFSDFSVYYGELEHLVKAVLQEARAVDEIVRSMSTIAAQWAGMKAEASETSSQQVESPNANVQESTLAHKTLFINENDFLKVAQLKRNLTRLAVNLKKTKNESEKLQNILQISEPNLQCLPPFENGQTYWHAQVGSKSIAIANHLVAETLDFIQELDFSPKTVRWDISGPKFLPRLLRTQSEKLEKATGEILLASRTFRYIEEKWRAWREKLNSDIVKKQAKPVRQKASKTKKKIPEK